MQQREVPADADETVVELALQGQRGVVPLGDDPQDLVGVPHLRIVVEAVGGDVVRVDAALGPVDGQAARDDGETLGLRGQTGVERAERAGLGEGTVRAVEGGDVR